MRIAFDLDDTLIPTTKSFAVGDQRAGFPLGLFFKESLRQGTVELLKRLGERHELWVYTSSLRSELYVKLWFLCMGVKIHRVINHTSHREAVKKNSAYSTFTKAPKLFEIDLLVDDSEGVLIECEKQGVNCLIIHVDDQDWCQKIEDRVVLGERF